MKSFLPYLLILILALLAAEGVYRLDPFGLEEKTIDLRFRLRGPVAVDHSDLILIAVDDATYHDLQQAFPFPRSYYAHIIDNLRRAGVRLIVFDIEFHEQKLDNLQGDSLLIAAMVPEREIGKPPSRHDVIHAAKYEEEDLGHTVYRYVIKPLPGLRPVSDWGLVNDLLDTDGYLRRYLLYQPHARDTLITTPAGETLRQRHTSYLPTLGMVTVRHLLELPDSTSFHVEGGLTRFGPLAIPHIHGNRNAFRINFYGPTGTFPTYSFSSILDDAEFDLMEESDTDYMEIFQDPELFKLLAPGQVNPFAGKVALVGVTIEELHDIKFTPFYSFAGNNKMMPGVETHAHAIQTLLDGTFLTEPHHFWDLLAHLLLILMVVAVTRRLSPGLALAMLSPLFLAVLVVPFLLFGLYDLCVNLTAPLTALAGSYLATVIYQYMLERRDRMQIHNMFAHYVPSSLVSKLIEDPDMLKLGGEEKELTVLFTDIAGFTTVSEQMEPAVLAGVLNEYLTAMSDIIMEGGGTIDKYEGDLIMAEFGAPVWFEDHARAGCSTVLKMQAGLRSLGDGWEKRDLPRLNARVGLNTGRMVVGNMGSDRIFDYTVIGDAVNLASRLEGIGKAYGTNVTISEFTAEAVGDEFVLRELDLVRVKGKKEPIRIFELVCERADAAPTLLEQLDDWTRARALYLKREWEQAIAGFQSYQEKWPDDPAAAVFEKRAREMITDPPPEDWDGAFTFMEK